MKTLGEHIRELREERDLSLRELATKIQVSAAFMSDVELGAGVGDHLGEPSRIRHSPPFAGIQKGDSGQP